MRHFLDLKDISREDLKKIILDAEKRKQKRDPFKKSKLDDDLPLDGKTLIMMFEKPSTRTRVSFDLAAKQLGGNTLMINPDDMHLGQGEESIHDTAKVLTQYADIIMLRTTSHKKAIEFSKHLGIPLINGLTDLSHPTQVLSDVFTIYENKGKIEGLKIAWVGDGNNMLNSFIEASVKFNFELNIGCPKKFLPNKKVLDYVKKNKAKINIFYNPSQAVKNVDCVMTDKYVSVLSDKTSKNKNKKKFFKKFQVNRKLMSLAKKDAIFLHCLPASRGTEVTNEVIDSKQSLVWEQALNRLYVQKAIICFCLK